MITRKKLTEAEDGFVKGKPASAPPPVTDADLKNEQTKEDKLSKLLLPKRKPPKEAQVRFTADLPEALHDRLSIAAALARKSKVELVREILNEVLPAAGE